LGLPHSAADGSTATTQDTANHYILSGGEVLEFDAHQLRQAYADFGRKPASHRVTIRRTWLAEPLPHGYRDTPREARFGPTAVMDSHEAVTWTIETTAQVITSTFRVGLDTASVTIPWAALRSTPRELALVKPVEITINGIPTLVETQTYLSLRGRDFFPESTDHLGLPIELSRIEADFIDLQRFMRGVQAFFLVDSSLRRDDSWRTAVNLRAGSGCISICLGCAGSALAGAGAYAALIASCGGALITGGSTALLCIAAFLGVQATHVAMLSDCGRCYECYTAQTGSPGPSRRDHGSSRLPENTFAKRRPGSATPSP
jgi:hypothetical protein